VSAEQNVETVRRGFEVLEREGREAWYAYMEPYASSDFEFCPVIAPGVDGQPLIVSFDEVREYLERVNEFYPDFFYADPAVESKGENVVLCSTRIQPRSGEPSPQLWAVFEFTDGLVSRLYNYVDEAAALRHAEDVADA
jgi:ketosteroid isomerase-like protein